MPNKAPLARAKEGPKAPTQARSTEEGAEGPRRLGQTQALLGKKVFNESWKLPALLYVFSQNSKLGYLENYFPDELEAWKFAVFVLSVSLGGPKSFKSLRFKMFPGWRLKKRVFSKTFVWSIYIQGIDARGEKTEETLTIAILKIETWTARRFEDNRLNCGVAEPDFWFSRF